MKASPASVMALWPRKAPGAKGNAPEDIPAVEIFYPKPEMATGAAVIVFPGGGYVTLAEHEGAPVARWLADHGMVSFVLRYRHAWDYKHPIPFMDARRAMRYVRFHAADWGIDPMRIGVLGFSAGGHLASMLATHFDDGDPTSDDPIERLSSRPDVQILIYPVITLSPNFGCWWNILGDNPPVDIINFFCTERHVRPQSPPAFLAHSIDDVGVPVLNSDLYAAALSKAEVPYGYVRTYLGDHGFGMVDGWTVPCVEWLRKFGFAAEAR